MANKLYGSIGELSNEVTKMYGSIGGLSSNIVKGYCSVGGLSKLFFGEGGGSVTETGFWFYYSTATGNIIEYRPIAGTLPPMANNVINKTNSGIAFYCISHCGENFKNNYLFVFSTNRNAIPYVDYNLQYPEYPTYPTIDSVTINEETWYYAYEDLSSFYIADLSPDCFVYNTAFSSMTRAEIFTWIINNRIYTDDFSEAYQANQTYNLVKADMEKTIRKFLAVYIYKTSEYLPSYGYTNAYNLLYNNIDTVVNYFLQNKGNNTIIDLWTTDIYSTKSIRFGCAYSNSDLNNVEVSDVTSFNGYSIVPCYDKEIAYSNTAVIDINGDGTITYESWSEPYEDYLVMGVNGENGFEYMHLSNVGLNFTKSSKKLTIAFHENYLKGSSYSVYLDDIEKTIRYAIQAFCDLNKNHVNLRSEALSALIDNTDTIVNHALSHKNDNGNTNSVGVRVRIRYQKENNNIVGHQIYVECYFGINPQDPFYIKTDKTTLNNYDYYETYRNTIGTYKITTIGSIFYRFSPQEELTTYFDTSTESISSIYIGTWSETTSYSDYNVRTANLGVEFNYV